MRVSPERALGGQRLGLEHVERGSAEGTVVEAGENVLFVLQAAAAGIDEHRRTERAVAAQLYEHVAIEDVARVCRERQQADENVGLAQERIETVGAVKAFDAFNGLRAAAPARNAKAEPPQNVGGVRPE